MLYVCGQCFQDASLRRVIKENAEGETCSFCCRRRRHGAALLDTVVEHIEECIDGWYDDANNVLLFDKEDSRGFAGKTWTTDELLRDELELELAPDSGKLFWAIVEGLGADRLWSDADPASLAEHDELRLNWREFSHRVMHAGRFFLLSSPRERVVLAELGARGAELGLVRELPVGTRLFRARQQRRAERWTTPAELGPPPDEEAVQSNRMSPPGISLFYAADDEATALAEMQVPGRYAVGQFELTIPASVLDLTRVPPVPSFFDLGARGTRSSIMFLSHFAEEISRPIARNERIHLEYIPTQVVTEYFRREYRGKRLLGIRYSSSQKPGGVCSALFAPATAVVDGYAGSAPEPEGRWLHLVGRRERRLRRRAQPRQRAARRRA